ncbi:MAG: hypothetical protein ABIR70_08040 [Bryobacteraceae bacterium]
MRELLPLTPEQFERARLRLMNPKPGSRIAAARDYGVDLTLLMEGLRKTPEQRADDAESVRETLSATLGIARKQSK